MLKIIKIRQQIESAAY